MGTMLKRLLKMKKNKKLEALCRQLYKELKTQTSSAEVCGKYLLMALNKQLEKATSNISSHGAYKVPMPSCGVISEKSPKTKKRKYRVFVFKNHNYKRSTGKKRALFG